MYGPSPYCGEDQQIRQNEGEPASPPLLHCSASAEAVPLQYVFQALLRVLPRCRVLLKRGTCSVSAPISDLQLLFGDLMFSAWHIYIWLAFQKQGCDLGPFRSSGGRC